MQTHSWLIKCKHTPETIDRIMMNFRKRGQMVDTLNYQKISETDSECKVSFTDEPEKATGIYKNLHRIEDVVSVHVLL